MTAGNYFPELHDSTPTDLSEPAYFLACCVCIAFSAVTAVGALAWLLG